jgi:prephenate dehydratase
MKKPPAPIAFQGDHGAYSESAAFDLFGNKCKTLPCKSFDAVITAVKTGKAGSGILPIENSVVGMIEGSMSLLSSGLKIVNETRLPIRHVLMCIPTTTFEKLEKVRSHPVALAQCTRFFKRHKHLKTEEFFDTAGAASSVAKQARPDVGAIAGERAAELYGLKIIKRNIADKRNNWTRFVVIAKT